jgi:hypothetical protein
MIANVTDRIIAPKAICFGDMEMGAAGHGIFLTAVGRRAGKAK